jgi:hypothetical protein
MIESEKPCPIHGDPTARPMLAADDLPSEVASCARCQTDWVDVKELRDLGRALRWATPDATRATRVRAAVLASVSMSGKSASGARPRLVRIAIGMITASAALAAVALVAHRPDQMTPRSDSAARIATGSVAPLGEVRPIGAALYERLSAAPDETVHLSEGRIHVTVVHLGSQQRFRILTGDAVVEVRGTEFEVAASADRLRAVEVERGRVEVTLGPHEPQVLGAGARWSATTGAAEAPPQLPLPEPAVAPVRHAVTKHASVRSPDRTGTAPTPSSTAPPAEPTPNSGPDNTRAPTADHGTVLPAASPPPPLPGPVTTGSASVVDSRSLDREERREERREQREERRSERLERRR